ncbi:hypothetical protein SOQ14_03690 [Erythrobacter sp. T5W1-R]|nr:hypothetical protein [Erythrobacter sp. T5W1-R]MEA1618012.1 hypothetical protein [Erythrobacter sp. T5W1-R]
MGNDKKTPSARMLAERDLLIGSLIVATGVLVFYICYLGGRGIGSMIFD